MGNHLGIEHGAPNLGPPRNMQDIGVNFTDPAMVEGFRVLAEFNSWAKRWNGRVHKRRSHP